MIAEIGITIEFSHHSEEGAQYAFLQEQFSLENCSCPPPGLQAAEQTSGAYLPVVAGR